MREEGLFEIECFTVTGQAEEGHEVSDEPASLCPLREEEEGGRKGR